VSVAEILVVDDNASNLLAIEAALAELGDSVQSARSGVEALRMLLERDFALILLDVKMPTMDGLETARLIRARKRSRHTPIIFMTAYGRDDAEVHAAYALGAVDFLFKPMLPEVLRAKAAVFVELQARTAEVARQAEEIREHQRREHERSLSEERHRWEAEALRREMQQLAEADRQKDRFLSVLSHELRTPLASITTGLELMRLKLGAGTHGADDSVLHTRDVMERQARHLARMVDDLLDLARIASGDVGLRKEVVPLSMVVDDALSATRALFEDNEHTLETDLPDGKVELFGDSGRLVQVLVNLLNNAARCTPARGVISLQASPDGTWVEIRVIDNGRGLESDELPHVFEEFRQETMHAGGVGLELSVVRQLVTMHGGVVAAKSAGPGMGSCFTVRLPMVAVASPPMPTELESQSPSHASVGPSTRPLAPPEREPPARYAFAVVGSGIPARRSLGGHGVGSGRPVSFGWAAVGTAKRRDGLGDRWSLPDQVPGRNPFLHQTRFFSPDHHLRRPGRRTLRPATRRFPHSPPPDRAGDRDGRRAGRGSRGRAPNASPLQGGAACTPARGERLTLQGQSARPASHVQSCRAHRPSRGSLAPPATRPSSSRPTPPAPTELPPPCARSGGRGRSRTTAGSRRSR
jgi:signal transduction histidine kinase